MERVLFMANILVVVLADCVEEYIDVRRNGLLGYVSSPGYPRGYPAGQNCVYNFTAEPGYVVHLTFIDFDIGERYSKSHQCLNDYVLLTVTDHEDRHHVGPRHCGDVHPPPLKTMQRTVNLRFQTTYSSASKKGFKLKYEFIREEKVTQPPSFYGDPDIKWTKQCGGHNSFDALDGEIVSPGFPATFPKNVSCHWLIRVNEDKRIYIRLIHLELSPTMAECDKASLHIIDGYKYELLESSSARRWIDQSNEIKFCGGQGYYNEEGMKSYLSQGNRVIIRFTTKDRPSAEQQTKFAEEGLPIGFKLLWTEVNSLVNEADVEKPCEGFTCNGGEVCLDDGLNICAARTKLCISKKLQCNGVSNCLENDHSDEHNCYSDQIMYTAIGAFFIILVCTILAIIVHRISMKREITRRLREQAKQKQKQLTEPPNNVHSQNTNNMDLQVNSFNAQPRQSDASVRSMASISMGRMRRFSPAFFSWSRRTSTADSVTPSMTLHDTPNTVVLNSNPNNNVWQFSKDLSPHPPRVRLQQLEPGHLHKRGAPMASSEDSDETRAAAARNRAVDEILRYSHTAAI